MAQNSAVCLSLWSQCVRSLEADLSEQQFNTWIRPLQLVEDGQLVRLLAPNRFVVDWVKGHCLEKIRSWWSAHSDQGSEVVVEVGTRTAIKRDAPLQVEPEVRVAGPVLGSRLNPAFTFDSFVEGKSNQLARAAAVQVARNPGSAYNPLFIYGGVGLGKTHLMQAIGNMIAAANPAAKVAYVHSERFVSDMVRGLRHNTIAEFKRAYRSLDALLIDDIQFFAGKDRSQEEFFHTFNALLEGQRQIVLTCDRYPKEVTGLEERLKSRFGWGLTVAIEPPELETSVAILMSKAAAEGDDATGGSRFLHGSAHSLERPRARGRVAARARELPGSQANPSRSTSPRKHCATCSPCRTSSSRSRTSRRPSAEYFKIRVADLLSKRRSRSIARPRQIAMALAKELTTHSLPEIGDAFGGRDHTTVLHACRRVKALRETETRVAEDYNNLLRTLTA